ncbi:matrix-remodeling-associated protein 5-like isoform X3 [Mytilus edulis]|uniref:matrix-remodeling-associated protein 5-like isoform X3 n=1 Tax=Mytilus edulis TaxID=6550 RepID=UPI0039F0FED4
MQLLSIERIPLDNLSIYRINYELSDVTVSPALSVLTTTENATLQSITCTAKCWPECSFKWTGPNNFIYNGTQLRLSNIQKKSSGQYQCQATNVVGTNYSNFFSIRVQHSPNQVSLLPAYTTYTRNEGDSLNVTCVALCEPACNFEWTFPNDTKHNSSNLQIDSLQRTNGGQYTCRASNNFGFKISDITVTINFGPREISLSPSDSNYTKKEGDVLGSIVCSADCYPACSFTWTYPDGTKRNSSSLYIYPLQKNHDGLYKCKGSNYVGYKEKNITVTVTYSPDEILLLPSITNYTKKEGDLIRVECSAVCEPACDFEWTYPNKTKQNIKILQIESLQGTDDGIYTCRAYNMIGYKESAFVVTINYDPKSIFLSPSDSNYTKKVGDTLGSIVCSADCNPACSFTWTYPDGTKHHSPSLYINPLQKNHEGIYNCRGFNDVGFEDESITVTINFDPGNSIFFSPSNTNYVMMEGNTLGDITCSANCKPSCTFEWTYPNGTKYLGSTLGIGRLNRTHAGVYKCKGYNHIGSSEKTITVAVNYPPESIRLSPTNTPFIVREFTTVRVTCEADCRPTCSYQWTGQNTWTSANKHLTLTSIRRTATGSYICRARNIINSYRYSETSVSIIVHTLPTKAAKMTAICTGSTAVSIAWIGDMTVFPKQNYELHYRTSSKPSKTLSISNSSNQQNIYLIHVQNLNPLTKYMFKIVADNYLGHADSEEVSCTTLASEAEDSEVNGALIGGVILISLAVLMFGVMITLILMYRFRRNTEDTQSQSCIHECFTKIFRSSKDNEGIYENTQPASECGNLESNGKKDSKVAAKNQTENTYEPIQRGKSDRQQYTKIQVPAVKTAGTKDSGVAAKNNSENTYEPIQSRQPHTTIPVPNVKAADLRRPLNPQYVNIEGNTKTNPDEKIALRPLAKLRPIRKT